MSVKPGQETECERQHRPIWTELEAVLRQHDTHNYSIFLGSKNMRPRNLSRMARMGRRDPTRKVIQ